MRKVILANLISLDGFFEGLNHDISWHNVDKEFNEYAIDFLNSLDTLLFGRVTYQLMESYWPTQAALNDDQVIAAKMNSLQKIVFSKTLDRAEWNNTKLVKENAVEEVRKLKQQPGNDIAIFGSSDLSLTFIKHNLIDEYRITVNPLFLGDGKALFKGIKERLDLKLVKTRTFNSGNVMLHYEPKSK
jgi:dihydrofolate reductase